MQRAVALVGQGYQAPTEAPFPCNCGASKRTYVRLRYRGKRLERGLRQSRFARRKVDIPFWFQNDLET